MDCLITGATGFVGSHLVAALRARGDTVRVLALPAEDATRLEQQGCIVYRGDVSQAETLARPLAGVDTAFHLAAVHGQWRPEADYRSINVVGTENVCRAALAAGVRRLIHVSSWAVYGMGLGRAADEGFPLRPFDDLYAVTKAQADELVQLYISRDHLPAVIVRPGSMFGPGDRVNFGRMADRLLAGKAVIIGSGRNLLPFVYVTDVVEGMLLAASTERAVGQIYNLATDRPLTQQQFWNAIAHEIGAKPPRLHVPYHALYSLAFVAERAVNKHDPQQQPLVTRLGVNQFGTENRHAIGKARAELGYSPRVSLSEGVHLTADWYLRQHRSGVK